MAWRPTAEGFGLALVRQNMLLRDSESGNHGVEMTASGTDHRYPVRGERAAEPYITVPMLLDREARTGADPRDLRSESYGATAGSRRLPVPRACPANDNGNANNDVISATPSGDK